MNQTNVVVISAGYHFKYVCVWIEWLHCGGVKEKWAGKGSIESAENMWKG